VGLELLPKEFTLGQLQRLYEAILLRKLDRGNFRKRIRKINQDRAIFKEVGSTPSRRGPESTLYRFNKLAYDRAVREGFNFEI
jgi:8-oxo-dGTP diphosphatase